MPGRRHNLTPVSKEEVREQRNYYLTESSRRTKVYKGDKRVHGGRLCAICHTKLSTIILSNGTTQATRDHHSCYFSSPYPLNICMDSRVCQKVHKEQRQLVEEENK